MSAVNNDTDPVLDIISDVAIRPDEYGGWQIVLSMSSEEAVILRDDIYLLVPYIDGEDRLTCLSRLRILRRNGNVLIAAIIPTLGHALPLSKNKDECLFTPFTELEIRYNGTARTMRDVYSAADFRLRENPANIFSG